MPTLREEKSEVFEQQMEHQMKLQMKRQMKQHMNKQDESEEFIITSKKDRRKEWIKQYKMYLIEKLHQIEIEKKRRNAAQTRGFFRSNVRMASIQEDEQEEKKMLPLTMILRRSHTIQSDDYFGVRGEANNEITKNVSKLLHSVVEQKCVAINKLVEDASASLTINLAKIFAKRSPKKKKK